MAPHCKYLLGGLGLIAATVCALPVASGFGAAPIAAAPTYQVNRTLKGDRLVVPVSVVAKRKVPVERLRPAPREPEETAERNKRKMLDGCEPAFSTVVVPSMAYVPSRCVG